MKSLKVLSILFAFLFLLASCTNPVKQRFDEVMVVHDEVMVKMDDINLLIEKTTTLKTQLLQDSTKVGSKEHLELEKQLKALNAADAGMWDWMHKFETPNFEATGEEAEKSVEYLNAEMEKIVKVADMINSSIKSAKAKLESSK